MKLFVVFSAFLVSASLPVFAWDGTNLATGDTVEIDKGNLVRTDEEIEVYDYGSGTYRSVTIESINSYGGSVELEVYDNDTGEYLILEMDD
jgi:hypothetical protein